MTPIRVAHVVEAAMGGVARHVLDLVTHLEPEEFPCCIYYSGQRRGHQGESFRALQERGILVREIPMARVPNPAAVATLSRQALRDGVSLLHLHSAKAGYLGRQAAQINELPAVYTPHAFPFQRTTDCLRPLYRVIERRLAAHTEKIICVSRGEYQAALAAGLPAEKLTVISNGLDISRWPLPTELDRWEARHSFNIDDAETVIGVLCRLVPQKGVDLLLQAAEDFLVDYPFVRLMICGDGPQRRMLEGLVRRLRLPRVTFVGAITDLWRAYAAMDIFCAPSRWEAGPYAVLEAMACGLPVVASDVPGHADYIDVGTTGLLFSIDFPGPLARALRSMLIDADTRVMLGLAGRKRVEQHFNLARMVEETFAVYRAVCASMPEPAPAG